MKMKEHSKHISYERFRTKSRFEDFWNRGQQGNDILQQRIKNATIHQKPKPGIWIETMKRMKSNESLLSKFYF